MTTLTDKRVRSAFARARDQIVKTYDRAFRLKPAPEQFWRELNEFDAALSKRLAVRPMPELELQAIVNAAVGRFGDLCSRFR